MSFIEGNQVSIPEATQIPTNNILEVENKGADETLTKITTPLIQVITPTPVPTQVNTLALCPPPKNWEPYSIQVGDSLASLSLKYLVSEAEIKQANCLEIDSLIPGSFIYLPKIEVTPTLTFTPILATVEQCGPPPSWVVYIIQSNDTLFELSILFNVSVPQLQSANCMGDSTILKTGTRFYVPFNLPTSAVSTFTPTLTVTSTVTSVAPSNTATISSTNTSMPTPLSTVTTIITATNTVAPPSATPIPPTQTPTAPAATITPIPPTNTPSNTPNSGSTPTFTPTPTNKP
jgi:LysM repeat protein